MDATKTLSHWEGAEWQVVMMADEVVFIGGPSGVGKSSVGLEMHAQLSAADVSHCVIDGDFLDMAYPTPWEHGLAERSGVFLPKSSKRTDPPLHSDHKSG